MLPPTDAYRCQYAVEWTAAELCWDLAADEAQYEALLDLAAEYPTTTVAYGVAP
ncbi:hypothetical protein [Streptomyces sp. NPDC058620]|uniref:hypothetical protein n=1 Tax=Streptomyces sp. NPDC058620 TaxID=3346560 RepID=UPI00366575A5